MLEISVEKIVEKERNVLHLSTIFCYLMLDFCLRIRIRFSLRDKRLFEITEVEIARVDCIKILQNFFTVEVIDDNLNLDHCLFQ